MKLALALLAVAATLSLDASAQQYEWGEHAPLEAGANITPDWGTPQAFVFTLSRFSTVTSSAAFHNLYGPPGPEVGNVVLFLRAPRRAILIGSYDFSGDSGPTHTFNSLVAGTYYYYVTSFGSTQAGSYYSLASFRHVADRTGARTGDGGPDGRRPGPRRSEAAPQLTLAQRLSGGRRAHRGSGTPPPRTGGSLRRATCCTAQTTPRGDETMTLA